MIASEFKNRRQQLMEQVGQNNIAIIASASVRIRNRDVDYPFRQDSDFYYLTGFNEANALAVFIPGRTQGEYILFCQEFDEKKALWEGAHAGLEGATHDYGADDSFPIDDLGIRNGMKKFVNNKMTPEKMIEVAKRWKPYRTVASWYIWRSLENK